MKPSITNLEYTCIQNSMKAPQGKCFPFTDNDLLCHNNDVFNAMTL